MPTISPCRSPRFTWPEPSSQTFPLLAAREPNPIGGAAPGFARRPTGCYEEGSNGIRPASAIGANRVKVAG